MRFKANDTVVYSANYLADTGYGAKPAYSNAKGKIVKTERIDAKILYLIVEWNDDTLPKRVNAKEVIKTN